MTEHKRGAEAFEAYYSKLYGKRWPELQKALMQQTQHCAWWNPEWEVLEQEAYKKIDELENLIAPSPEIKRKLYYLDSASAYCVEALNIRPEDRVLDMCAAPGGKSLGLAMKLGPKGELICNELSANRRGRLKRVIQDFLTESQRERVHIMGRDAGRFGLERPWSFDRILLDAPCSSERHLLHNDKEMQRWSPSRSKKLSKTQGTLLASAFDALKPGGRLVYSTCSLSELENDAMGDWLLTKRPDAFRFEFMNFSRGERTRFGHIFLPDQDNGSGPLYLAVIQRFEDDC